MVIYKIFVFGADRKSNMAARAHNVFWLVEILKIFLLETTKPIELCDQSEHMAAMLDFRSAPKTKNLYMTIQWTFLLSLIQICFVVSEKKMSSILSKLCPVTTTSIQDGCMSRHSFNIELYGSMGFE
jgi:hypothetical protein